MAEPFLGEVRMMSFGFPPQGWALCNGSLLPINQNQALFALLGTYFGGNGQTNFGLPNLRGRVPVMQGSNYVMGQQGGIESHTINISEMPSHTHNFVAVSDPAATNVGTTAFLATKANTYTGAANPVTLSPLEIGNTGGSQAHNNIQPTLVISFCIALQGIFPSQN